MVTRRSVMAILLVVGLASCGTKLNEKVPYRVVGGVRFYERKEVKDLIAWLRGSVNPQDAVSIAAIGTRAFVRCCARDGAKKEGGVYSAPDLGGTSWQIHCGTRNGTYGIATLYPTNDRPTCAE